MKSDDSSTRLDSSMRSRHSRKSPNGSVSGSQKATPRGSGQHGSQSLSASALTASAMTTPASPRVHKPPMLLPDSPDASDVDGDTPRASDVIDAAANVRDGAEAAAAAHSAFEREIVKLSPSYSAAQVGAITLASVSHYLPCICYQHSHFIPSFVPHLTRGVAFPKTPWRSKN
jgi:hypothetical protein